jgi:hypothetical protein
VALVGLMALALLALTVPVLAKESLYTSGGLALSGYDAVAYFSDGKPVKGHPEYAIQWGGARWQFATAANRDAFVTSPGRYVPQYGGYGAYAVSKGYTASADPMVWRIVEDRLYVNYSKSVQGLWEQDIPGNIVKANGNWPAVLTK